MPLAGRHRFLIVIARVCLAWIGVLTFVMANTGCHFCRASRSNPTVVVSGVAQERLPPPQIQQSEQSQRISPSIPFTLQPATSLPFKPPTVSPVASAVANAPTTKERVIVLVAHSPEEAEKILSRLHAGESPEAIQQTVAMKPKPIEAPTSALPDLFPTITLPEPIATPAKNHVPKAEPILREIPPLPSLVDETTVNVSSVKKPPSQLVVPVSGLSPVPTVPKPDVSGLPQSTSQSIPQLLPMFSVPPLPTRADNLPIPIPPVSVLPAP